MISTALKYLRETEGRGGANEKAHSFNEDRVNKALGRITALEKEVKALKAARGDQA